MAAAVVSPIGRGRPSNSVLSDRLERSRHVNTLLRIENRALRSELTEVGVEISALSSRTVMAIHADRPDVALHVAGRLDALAESLSRRGAA